MILQESETVCNAVSLQTTAKNYLDAGLASLPVRAGEKRPAVKSWTDFKERPVTLQEHNLHWASEPGGIGVVCGPPSGGLECIDVDIKNDPNGSVYKNFSTCLKSCRPDLVDRLVKEHTPSGGYHFLYRVSSPSGNAKLARAAGKKEAVLETRGLGGFLVVAPTPGYVLCEGSPPMSEISTISEADRDLIWNIAKSCDESQTAPPKQQSEVKAGLPGTDFNERRSAIDFLCELGWKPSGRKDSRGNDHLIRPGKSSGTSATWHAESGTFHCFTTSTSLPAGPHSLFSVYAHEKCGGDFSAAASELSKQGYGSQEHVEVKDSQIDWPLLSIGGDGLPATSKELMFSEPPVLIPGLLRTGNRLIVGASVKVGKSIVVNNLAFSLAEGREWLGKELPKKKVLLVDLEVDEWELKKRLFGLARRDDDGVAVYPDNLCRLSLRKRPEFLDRGRLLDCIRMYDEQHNFDCIIIDCLYQVLGGLDENSNSDMATLGGWFTAMESRGAAVVVVHHFGKGESHSKNIWDRFRGASSMAALFDAAVTLGHHEKKNHLIAEFGARSFAEDDAIVLKYDSFPKLVVAEGENAQNYRRQGRPACEDDPVVTAIYQDPTIQTSSLASQFGLTQQTVRDRAGKAGLKSVKQGASTSWAAEEDGQITFLGEASHED
jgi:hypothetical protein